MRQLDQLRLEDFADYGFDDGAMFDLRRRFAAWPRRKEDDEEGRAAYAAVATRDTSPRR